MSCEVDALRLLGALVDEEDENGESRKRHHEIQKQHGRGHQSKLDVHAEECAEERESVGDDQQHVDVADAAKSEGAGFNHQGEQQHRDRRRDDRALIGGQGHSSHPSDSDLLSGRTVPWDFVLRQTNIDPGPGTTLPPPVRRTPQQATRRRLVAGGIWRRP